MQSSIQIVRVVEELPEDAELLRADANAEDFRHMEMLIEHWESGAERFGKEGEALFAAYVDGDLAGIGGVTREPTNPGGPALRARRVHVLRKFRGMGVGRALAGAIVQQAFESAPTLYVHSDRAGGFWERMGFSPISHAKGVTHHLERIQTT